MRNQKKSRSFSQSYLESSALKTLPFQQEAAKNKLIQLKKAKEKIEKVLQSDMKEYQIFQENLHNKKDYYSNKETSLISDLFETNRLYTAEKNRFTNPVVAILSDPSLQEAYLQTLKNEYLQISILFQNPNAKKRLGDLNQEKLIGIKSFFKIKEEEARLMNENSMLREDINGKIIRNLEYAMVLEEYDNKLFEAQRTLSACRKQSNNLNLSGELPDYRNPVYQEKKRKRNELELTVKVSEENIRVLTLEIDSFRRKLENLKKFVEQVENENNMQEFEANIHNCLNEDAKACLIDLNQEFFEYKHFFNQSIEEIHFDEIQESQKYILKDIDNFPKEDEQNEQKNPLYEILKEGLKKNKHFKDNLAVFFEIRVDIFSKIRSFYEGFQKKQSLLIAEKIKRADLMAEYEESERGVLLMEAENSRNNPRNMIKIKDLLTITSHESELVSTIDKLERESQEINEKRNRNQKILEENIKNSKQKVSSFSVIKDDILKTISHIYRLLIEEKAFIEELKENLPLPNQSNQIEPILEIFYSGLNRNFSLLENHKKNEICQESVEKNIDLYKQKLEFLSSRLEKTKSENLQEMCLLNEKILSQQLKIEQDQERIRTLEKFIQDLKFENGLKTTENTRKTEEEEVSQNNRSFIDSKSVDEIFSLEKPQNRDPKIQENKRIFDKSRQKSVSFVKPAEKNCISRFGNVIINLQVSQVKSIKQNCDFPLQIGSKKKEIVSKKIINLPETRIDIYKLTGNDQVSDISKPRVLRILANEKKFEILKKYELGGKEKIAVENAFYFQDIKRFEAEVFINKNKKKEVIFKLEVALLGLLRLKIKNYDLAKQMKNVLKECGLGSEEKETSMKKIR